MLNSGFYMNTHRCVCALTHRHGIHTHEHTQNVYTTDTTKKEVEETELSEALFKFYPSSTI